MITEEQKKAYLENSGACPFCKKMDIQVADQQSPEFDIFSQLIICNGCGKSWWEIYELTDIEEVNK